MGIRAGRGRLRPNVSGGMAAPNANHGRWTLPVIPATMPDMPHNWYVTAERAD